MIFVVLVFALQVTGPSNSQLITAIGQHESNGNDYAVKNGCYGYLQCKQVCVDDVNKFYHTHYKASDTLGNRELSIEIFQKYMALWSNKRHPNKMSKEEFMARLWNGGPNGPKYKSTARYWRAVKRHMSP
jgi:hypothetical protein